MFKSKLAIFASTGKINHFGPGHVVCDQVALHAIRVVIIKINTKTNRYSADKIGRKCRNLEWEKISRQNTSQTVQVDQRSSASSNGQALRNYAVCSACVRSSQKNPTVHQSIAIQDTKTHKMETLKSLYEYTQLYHLIFDTLSSPTIMRNECKRAKATQF